MTGTVLGLVAGSLELALAASWFHLLNRVRIPADRRPFLVAHAVAATLGVAAFALGTSLLGAAFAGIGIVSAAIFLGLAAGSAQARKTPAVAVGGPVLEFLLPDHEGRPFDLASLRGRPFLLKFFRGHW